MVSHPLGMREALGSIPSAALKDAIGFLEGPVGFLEGAMESLEGAMGSLEGAMGSLEGEMGSLEGARAEEGRVSCSMADGRNASDGLSYAIRWLCSGRSERYRLACLGDLLATARTQLHA